MKKILDILFLLNPQYWYFNNKYSQVWDDILLDALEKYNFTKCTECSAQLGPIKVWVANHPYASFTPYECLSNLGEVRPSRQTIHKAHKKYIKSWIKQKNASIEEYTNLTHCTKDVPDGFYDFTGGSNIEKRTVLEWIESSEKHVIDKLIKGDIEASTHCSSGNTIVMTEGYVSEHEGKKQIYLETMVSKSYSQRTKILDMETLEPLF